ncbi:hypothetical protein C6P45_000997 [Maudiozyma exigua]|uniref:t-SNARE coiled-coil homology domain-containing protein n=1 Tax=Maudiozyma exigua TaxID=34358 RepID=A0A9P6WFL8_MAUEX|nr:hypothetical protein C6P45_000997 [Kazachstania exigua]
MSFLDLQNQKPASQIVDDTRGPSNLISEYANQVKILSRQIHQLQTVPSSSDLSILIKTKQIPLCHAIRDQIINLRLANGSKLQRDYQDIQNQLETVESNFNSIDIMKKVTIPETTNKLDDSTTNYVSIKLDEHTPLLEDAEHRQVQTQTQQQLQQDSINSTVINQEDLDFHTIIQQDRDAQVSRIHGAVNEVNAIFHQLGTLIQEQGEQVDTIDEHINQFGENIHRANDQLKKADENQRKRNKCGMITLMIVCIVFLTIILVILS